MCVCVCVYVCVCVCVFECPSPSSLLPVDVRFCPSPPPLHSPTRAQGEQNSGADTPTLYQCAQPDLVLDWRAGFRNPNLFFAVVQLAPWIGGANFNIAIERFAQESVLTVPLTGIATAIDLGDPTAPYGSVHPRRKQAVGARLAANALALVRGPCPLPSAPCAFARCVRACVRVACVLRACCLCVLPACVCAVLCACACV